jgi:hypothetical protein
MVGTMNIKRAGAQHDKRHSHQDSGSSLTGCIAAALRAWTKPTEAEEGTPQGLAPTAPRQNPISLRLTEVDQKSFHSTYAVPVWHRCPKAAPCPHTAALTPGYIEIEF